ncbi:MAG: UDPglucose 6-dehydrogenase [Parcubacteria group bacterium Gr01-1014_29]|nr:MAG: UDPglucose 6-dehydrogenase [Parcubacteria group bacterium Gr01-1014_29]
MSTEKITIGVVGVGMVGSQLARYFKEARGYRRGKDLFLYDKDPKKRMQDDVNKASIIFLCVPTPPTGTGGACDTSAIDAVMKTLTSEKTVVVKSTVPPGTTERLQKAYPHHVLFNPEFLTESRAWEDMLRPDRQVVGYTNNSKDHASMVLNLLPKAFFASPGTQGTYNFIRINATEAEMGKYAGNVFGALKVTYANILADLCEAVGQHIKKENISSPVEYEHVRMMLAHDHRIGDAWLNVEHNLYRGFGGACFPKDVSALRMQARTLLKKIPRGAMLRKRFEKAVKLLDAVWEYNETLLASQGLTVEDVSVHDREWISKKLSARGVLPRRISLRLGSASGRKTKTKII